eukprot:COSAG01_NODE_12830_length_1679_cov_6.206412_3_plen_159_part_00
MMDLYSRVKLGRRRPGRDPADRLDRPGPLGLVPGDGLVSCGLATTRRDPADRLDRLGPLGVSGDGLVSVSYVSGGLADARRDPADRLDRPGPLASSTAVAMDGVSIVASSDSDFDDNFDAIDLPSDDGGSGTGGDMPVDLPSDDDDGDDGDGDTRGRV